MTINCKGKLIDLSTPHVMGILNLTPDSFFDGGSYQEIDQAMDQTAKMLEDGATFIDVGAYSSRPNAIHIPIEEEERRLIPMIKELVITFPEIIISVDTFRASVARQAIENGASLINDISAGQLDDRMMDTVGALAVPYVMMHMRGTPQSMKTLVDYEDVTKEVIHYFSSRIALARKHKINDILIDPGFGFAKTTSQSFELLKNLQLLHFLEMPFLVGVSRKSMIQKTLAVSPDKALNGTTALHMAALLKGAKILRAHDVKEAMECMKIFNEIA